MRILRIFYFAITAICSIIKPYTAMRRGMPVRYTVSIVAEKVLELLEAEPLRVHVVSRSAVNGFSTVAREQRDQDILWVVDNSDGSRPYAGCGARHCLYIASPAEEAGGLPECEADRSLIVLPHATPIGRLVSALEQCFAFYNAWGEALLDIVRRGGDWFALLEEGYRVLRNPMILYNRSMRLLAYTVDDGTGERMWVDTVREGVPRVDSPRESEDLMRFLKEVECHDVPFRFEGEGMSQPFWSAPVLVDGRRCGMVNVVEFHRPLSPGDRDLMSCFAEIAAVKLRRADYEVPVPDAMQRQFMRDLLGGDIASRDRLNTRLIAVDWRTRACFRFVSLRTSLPFLAGEQWRSNYEQLAALGLDGLMSMIDREEPHIALLLTGDGPESFARPLEMLGQFCAMRRLRAGVSDVYGDLLETPRYCRQAEAALELQEGAVCNYGEARYARLLRHLRSHPYREDLMHPAVARLAALDGEEGTEYIPTLRALIRHAFNQLETADALGIHRTTLAYRLRRAQELTGLRLSDPDQVFHVSVSLRLMGD